jgi:hypothetical protein
MTLASPQPAIVLLAAMMMMRRGPPLLPRCYKFAKAGGTRRREAAIITAPLSSQAPTLFRLKAHCCLCLCFVNKAAASKQQQQPSSR